MKTFQIMYDRIATELRRSNLVSEIKDAINDAIDEASKNRFYFNEMRGLTFNTVSATEYYDDQGIVEIDAIYTVIAGSRRELREALDTEIDCLSEGNVQIGQPFKYARRGTEFRLYPVPDAAYTVVFNGYGKLSPSPLVNPTDTNAWVNDSERYIRALAKSYVFRDVIRDAGEATLYAAMAEDYKQELLEETTTRIGTGQMRPTQF